MSRNRLGAEKSPYLLQHRDNPVWWYPWGEEAFAAARERNVPVFLSVGYSTCHWCHVMERESFEDEQVAALLNESFVAIKVDREERPDVDAIYMDAVHALGQRGGWPMSVWLTPSGEPFAAGTYFPRPNFLRVLDAVREAWRDRPEAVREQAGAVLGALERSRAQAQTGALSPTLLSRFLRSWQGSIDPQHGGRRGAPKFPPAYDLQLLLRIHRRSGDRSALEMVRLTLDRMAASGMYDHLGGGFHRYSTDERWLVPHFEKMLYDQASLVLAYLEGWQVTGRREYELVVRETIDYVLRDLCHPDGGFYSAEDADSEGEEGLFYVWRPEQVEAVLDGPERDAALAAFDITSGGNFERGATVLSLVEGHAREQRSPELARAMEKLLEHRSQRVRPHLDDKVLTDWNGLMIAAIGRAGRLLDEPRHVEAAARAARFVLDRLRTPEGALLHRWRDGDAGIGGFLDDHAFLVHGLIELHQATFDPAWIDAAVDLQRRQDELFGVSETGDYFATDGRDATVPLRRVEMLDNVVPAGRSVAALNLLRLGDLLVDPTYTERAGRVFAATPRLVDEHPVAFAQLLIAFDYADDRSKEIAVVGQLDEPATRAALEQLASGFHPNRVVAVGDPARDTAVLPLLAGRPRTGDAVTIHVCENRTCQLPTTDAGHAAELAGTHEPLVLEEVR
jgi:hypothetical protein